MTNTFTWAITSLPTTTEGGHDDVVCQANWLCTASDGATPPKTISLPGTSTFTYDPDAPYTPRADLTEAQALEWVWSKINRTDIEAYLDAQLSISNPPLPWDAR